MLHVLCSNRLLGFACGAGEHGLESSSLQAEGYQYRRRRHRPSCVGR